MIELKEVDNIYEMKLSRPPVNEIGSEMLAELERCLKEIRSFSSRALIIYSDRDEGFSAGADLRELYHGMLAQPKESHAPALRSFLDRIHRVMNTLDTLPIPTIGVIQGVCFGGGFELALTCDILIAEPTARFCFPELRLGIIPCFGGIPRLKRDVGNALIRDLLLTGRSINAQKALEVGIVSQRASQGEGLAVARRLAQQLRKYDTAATAEAKRFLKPVPWAELEAEKETALRLFSGPSVQKALKTFVESNDVRPYLA